MPILSSIGLWIVYTTVVEAFIYRLILGRGGFSLWAKVLFINIASFLIALAIGVGGYFSFDWPFITSWGLAQWFLVIIVSEFLPMAAIFGDLGFKRLFTLLIFSNFVSTIVLCLLILYIPQALEIESLDIDYYKEDVFDGIAIIKDALERYKANNGEYPAYIYGGDQISWQTAGEPLDPLLREGYLEVYPTNVYNLGRSYYFPRRVRSFAGVFWGLESEKFKDLKKVWGPVVNKDPRFGYRGTKMGNILSDSRIPLSMNWFDLAVYRGTAKQYFLPGAFLYRSYDLDGNGLYDSYILAGFGSEETQGEDIFNQKLGTVAYMVDGKLVPGSRDRMRDGVIIIETGGFKKWRE